MTPFFSIIIPVYNKERFVKNTLETVLNQAFQNYEIIVVNDGSTDNSLEILRNISDRRLKIFDQENQGAATSRNNGMKNATAPYLCFLDADDSWTTDHLTVLADAIAKFPAGKMFCSRYVTQINHNTFVKNNLLDIADDYEGYVEDFFKSSYVNRVALTSAVCIHESVFKELGGFNNTTCSTEDLEYWIKIALNYKVVITAKTTMVYNFITDNSSLSKIHITKKTVPDFDIYAAEELQNQSLKRFLDLYRVEYALQFKIVGDSQRSRKLLQKTDPRNINLKTKILLKLPSVLLQKLLKVKHVLKSRGIDFSIYH